MTSILDETALPVGEAEGASTPEPFEEPVYVTRPFLPPLEEFCTGLKEIWQSGWLTNNGPVLKRFTRQLSNYFETAKYKYV